jgi:hypothetical protein
VRTVWAVPGEVGATGWVSTDRLRLAAGADVMCGRLFEEAPV